MQVQFNKPVTLGKTTFGKGQHAVPAEDCAGWFFDAMVKDGTIIVLRDETVKKTIEPTAPTYTIKSTRKARRKAVAETPDEAPETDNQWG